MLRILNKFIHSTQLQQGTNLLLSKLIWMRVYSWTQSGYSASFQNYLVLVAYCLGRLVSRQHHVAVEHSRVPDKWCAGKNSFAKLSENNLVLLANLTCQKNRQKFLLGVDLGCVYWKYYLPLSLLAAKWLTVIFLWLFLFWRLVICSLFIYCWY